MTNPASTREQDVVERGRRWRFRVKAGRAKGDPEKLVIPGLLYASEADGDVAVHLLALGWWDWHVSFLVARIRTLKDQSHD